MKQFFLLLLIISGCKVSIAQTYFDKIRAQARQVVANSGEDTTKILALNDLADSYNFVNIDSAFFYARQVTELSQKLNYAFGKFLGSRIIYYTMMVTANYPRALEIAHKNLEMAEHFKNNREALEWSVQSNIATTYRVTRDFPAAIARYHQAVQLYDQAKKMGQPIPRQVEYEVYITLSFTGAVFLSINRLDSAIWYARKGYELCLTLPDQRGLQTAYAVLGNVFEALGNNDSARYYYHAGIQHAISCGNIYFLTRIYKDLAGFYRKTNRQDSCVYYGQKALELGGKNKFGDYTSIAASTLAGEYETLHQSDSALKYLKMMLAIKDTIFSQAKAHQFQFQVFDEQQRQKEIDTEKERYANRLKVYALLGAAAFFLVVTIILLRNNLLRKKANRLLESQKNEIDRQKTTAENALHTLETTQAQLIQSEKMASLGELTAGIAHEIQNPLNFVNNFSEVNKELIEELEGERRKSNGERNEKLEEELLQDMKQNLEKIYLHGQRADAIVKGMLQHSRSNTGIKELADINVLADEYLRLAYHGFRAKDKDFNVTMQSDFDPSAGKINIIPQDIGRVLLNLFSNAFYAVHAKASAFANASADKLAEAAAVAEKKKHSDVSYLPSIYVSTKRLGKAVEIRVQDNGDGIPENIRDKIFQPFFTTKPTGQGTGLGLSLSYDIIKAHGGEIKVENLKGGLTGNDDQGSVFIIILPDRS